MIKVIALLMLMASLLLSATPGANVDGAYEISKLYTIYSTEASDTVAGTDTSVILSDYSFNMGYDYVLEFDSITVAADSCSLIVQLCVYEPTARSKTFAYYVSVDSIKSAAGRLIEIPAEKLFGYRFKIRLIGYGLNDKSLGAVLNKVWMYQKRNVSFTKPSRD